MNALIALSILLSSNFLYAGNEGERKNCSPVLVQIEPVSKNAPAPVPEIVDQTPVIMAYIAARRVDMDAWRELASLNRARTARLESSGLSETAMGTKIRRHIGRMMDLLENRQKYEFRNQNLWIWYHLIRIYRLNHDNEKLISECREHIEAGRLEPDEGKILIEALEREVAENQLLYAEAFAYYRGVSGFLRKRAEGVPMPKPEREAPKSKAKVLAETADEGSGVAFELVAIEPPDPAPGANKLDKEQQREKKIAEDAAWILKELDDRAKQFSEMFPNRNFPNTMPTWEELSGYHERSAAQSIEYRNLEAEMDKSTSFKLFILSGSLLAPARWAVKKFLPLPAQAHVFKLLKLGEDNATRIRYVPDIFDLFKVDPDQQIAALRDKNAPTEDQLLVALARMFPRTYVRLLVEAREEGKAEAERLRETVPPDLTVVPENKDRSLSPRLNFYYRMVVALRAAQIMGDLSIDHNNNVGQRVAAYMVGGTAALGGTVVAVQQHWPTIQTYINSIRAYLGF